MQRKSDAARVTHPTCRKEHGRCAICNESIKPGERYFRVAIPPWMGAMEIDHNDDWPWQGGSQWTVTYINTHVWEIHETHEECEERRAEEMREAAMELEDETPVEYDY